MTPGDVTDRLRALGNALPGAIRKALGRFARTIAKAIRDAAPIAKAPYRSRGKWITPGALKRGIKSSAKRRSDGIFVAKAGVSVSQGFGKQIAPHGHLIALGTVKRHTGEKGVWTGRGRPRRVVRTKGAFLNRGRVTPNSFAKTAANSALPIATSALIDSLRSDVDAAAKTN